MLHRLLQTLGVVPPDTVHHSAPEGAWIPPTVSPEPFAGLSNDGGRPVMDAAAAHAHNETLFHGAYTWGLGCALLICIFAWVWSRVR